MLMVSSRAVITSLVMLDVVEAEHGDVLRRRFAFAHGHREAALEIADHLVGLEFQAPGGEQGLEVRGLVRSQLRHRVVRIVRRPGPPGHWDRRTRGCGRRAWRTGRWRTAPRAAAPSDARCTSTSTSSPMRRERGFEIAHGVELLDLRHRPPRAERGRPVCMSKSPCMGSEDSQPTTGFFGARRACGSAWRRRIRAALRAADRGTGWLPGRRWNWWPRDRGRAFRRWHPRAPNVTPSSVARSSSSEKGCGSMTFSVSLPSDRATSSSSSSRTRMP